MVTNLSNSMIMLGSRSSHAAPNLAIEVTAAERKKNREQCIGMDIDVGTIYEDQQLIC